MNTNPLPNTVFPVLFLARITTALTWGWTALTAAPWNDYGWLRDAVTISKHHTWVPGWSSFADTLAANLDWIAPLFFLWNLYLFATLMLGFATRFNGTLAVAWAAVLVVLSISIPKTGANIPESFPVPIGGWFWLLGPILLFPLAAAARTGRLWGLDASLHGPWSRAGGLRAKIARWM